MRKIFTKQLVSVVVFILTTSIGLISFPCIIYGNDAAQGKINQNISELKRQGVFEVKETKVFSVATTTNSGISKVVSKYTLLNVTNGISEILMAQPEYLKLIIPIENGSKNLTVLLYKENISPNGFTLLTSGGIANKRGNDNDIVHYRGSIDNDAHSIAAITFSNNETMGLISSSDGNYVLGKIEKDVDGKFILYNDRDLVPASGFECSTTDIPESNPHIKNPPISTTSTNCVNWYWESDYNVYQDKGSLANVNSYMQGVFNQVSALYANDGISITLKTLFVWTTADPYTGPSSTNYLDQFGTYRTSFDGDLAHLIGFTGGTGGLAWVGTLCNSTAKYKMAYSGVSSSYNNIPTYSWTVNCISHEQGHNLGSSHTHACVWNGNNTAIDGCSTPSGCPDPGLPAGGGTIMSYCHLTGVGVNFSLGFGPQPTALILNNVNNASCLFACTAVPTAQFTASPTSGCAPILVNFTDQSIGAPSSWAWDIDNNGSTDYTMQNPTHTYTSSGTYSVKLTVSNSNGNNSLVKTGYITVGSAALPFVEDFEIAAFPPTGWSITQSPSDSKTWSRNTAASGNGASAACASMDFYTYSTSGGEKDNLITKPIDLTGITGAAMTFKVAYRNYPNPVNYDTLRVYISSDCGSSFGSAVYTKGGTTLATAGSSSSSFTPSLSSQWRTDTVNLNAYTGNNIVVKFEGRNSYGNNLYIDDINITGGLAPAADFIGALTTLCIGGTVSFTDQSANSPASWSWTFSGGAPASSTAQNPSVVYNTPGTYSVSLTAANGFGNNTKSRINYITVNPSPTVTATPASTTICKGNSTALNAGGATSYIWSPPTALNAATGSSVIANPTTAITYTVTGTSAGCVNTATAIITVNSSPTVTTTPNSTTICKGNSITLTAGGANSYSWSPATALNATTGLSVTANPTASITYTVTGTSNGCTDTRTIIVAVNSSPTVTLTPASTICTGSSIMLSTSGANTYTWSPATALNAATGSSVIANPTSTITYTVTGTSAGCTNTNTVMITVSSPAITISPASASICIGDSAMFTAGGANIYAWNTGETSAQITVSPTATATYSVIGTDPAGCIDTQIVTVTVISSPTLTITPASATICAGSSTTLIASGASMYAWNTGETSSSITVSPTSANIYTVTGTNTAGCTNTQTVTISVIPSPAVTITPVSTTICSGSSSTLTASGANIYAWNTGETSAQITVNPTVTTAYTITGTNAAGCTNTQTVTVTVSSTTVTISPASAILCTGGSATLTAGGTSIYAWNTGETSAEITVNPTITATYSVIGTDPTGCIDTQMVTVTVTSSPTVTITPASATICAGSSTTLIAGGASMYAWNTGETSSLITVSPTSANIYTVTGTLSGGCTDTQTSSVTVNSSPSVPIITQVGNTLISSSSTGNQWYFNSSLMPGETNDTLIALQSGNYHVIVTDVNGCTAASLTVAITVTGIVNPAITENDFLVFPNPSEGVFEISFNPLEEFPTGSSATYFSNYTIEITNTLGQIIYKETIAPFSRQYRKAIDLRNAGKGVYRITLKSSNNQSVEKAIVIHVP